MASNDNNNETRSNIPEKTNSKPMDSMQDVKKSPDEKTDQDFPGYPHYPAKEDIMDQSTGSHRVDVNLEEMGTGPNATGVSQRYANEKDNGHSGNDGERDGRNEEIGVPHNVSNEDLKSDADIPGSDIQEAAEKGSTNP